MTKEILILILIATTVSINAQERCGTEAITKHMTEIYPKYKTAKKEVNTQTERWIKNHPNNSEKIIITIPVVVHVVWNTNTQNISDAQIQSQIDVLNRDYRRTNIDQINTENVWLDIAADCEIEFCLATTDPNGQPTNGVNRVQTTHAQFGMDNDIHTSSSGGADDWPNNDYLNIWVCDLGNNGLLGYATPPSGWIGDGDGVVIGYTNFGITSHLQYGKGRTATHEVGHWLNLKHIWGNANCGDDEVEDTPKQMTENSSCPGYPHNANSCGTINPDGDMFMNYMDYTNDACMNLFTVDQKTRMIAAINLYRPSLIHNTCSDPTSTPINISNIDKNLVKIIDILGRETSKQNTNTPLIYIYDDGSVEKKIIIY